MKTTFGVENEKFGYEMKLMGYVLFANVLGVSLDTKMCFVVTKIIQNRLGLVWS